MRIVKVGSKQFQKLCDRNSGRNKRVCESVRKIVDDVKEYGDEAVIRYTRKFDRVKLTPRELRVSAHETSGAYQDIKPEFVSTLKVVIDNINKFYKKQLKKSWKVKDADGVLLGEQISALDTVGVYVPAGTVPVDE